MTTFNTRVEKIAELTDENYHCEALIEGAKLLGKSNLVKIFTDISEEHKKLGHMPAGLSAMRTLHASQLMTFAKNMLTAKDFKAFHGAY